HTRWPRDWSSDVCSSDLTAQKNGMGAIHPNQLRSIGGEAITTMTAEAAAARSRQRMGIGRGVLPEGSGSEEEVTLAEMGTARGRSEERRVGKEWRWGGSG